MRVLETRLNNVSRVLPTLMGDERGWFTEAFNRNKFLAAGLPGEFVQDNQSMSRKGVLRGLHYQLGRPQGKLVRVISGHIWDVALDLRRSSPTFGRYEGFHLRAPSATEGMEMLWIPEGFAHGFLVLSETAEVLYKTTDSYYPEGERCILWNDPALAIAWPLNELGPDALPTISAKDEKGSLFSMAELP